MWHQRTTATQYLEPKGSMFAQNTFGLGGTICELKGPKENIWNPQKKCGSFVGVHRRNLKE